MKINQYHKIYQNKDNYRKELRMLSGFSIRHEAEIKHHQLENVKLVLDYKGDPIMEDKEGNPQDWFHRLYHIKYETKLRILPL